MIKYYCDRCGKEASRHAPVIQQYCLNEIPGEIYLCNECQASFKSWLNRQKINALEPERAADPEGWKENILGFF